MPPPNPAALDSATPDSRTPVDDAHPSGEQPASEETQFRAFYPVLYATAFRILGESGEADEVAITALGRFFRNRPDCVIPLAWLRRCTITGALDLLRARQRRDRRERSGPPPTQPANPEQLLLDAEQQAQVRAVLAELSPREAALLLARAEGHSYAEIGEMLALKPASVGTLLARAAQQFQKRFKRRYGQ